MKSCCVLQDHYDDERNKTVFHDTTSDLQDQDRFFLVSDRSCPKTDGLRPHHCKSLLTIVENTFLQRIIYARWENPYFSVVKFRQLRKFAKIFQSIPKYQNLMKIQLIFSLRFWTNKGGAFFGTQCLSAESWPRCVSEWWALLHVLFGTGMCSILSAVRVY